MPFTVNRNPDPPRQIVIGGPKIQPPSTERAQGRKKMADDKKLNDETGVKKVSQEPADKQGPVGTGSQPARPAQPEGDVKIGGKEERDNA